MKLLFLLLTVLMWSCMPSDQNSQQASDKDSMAMITDSIATDTIAIPSIADIDSFQMDSFKQGFMLIPEANYRLSVKNEIGDLLAKKNWLALYKDDDGYHMDQLEYTLQNKDEEPCSGMPTQAIHTKRNTLLLLAHKNIPLGKVDSIPFPKEILRPNIPLEFQNDSKTYKLVAHGIDFSTESLSYDNKQTYKVDLFVNGKFSRTLIQQSHYNDTQTTLRFIGDLDKDGIPDFIFESPRDYEEERYILILSSDPHYYEESRQFDC